eukprot:8146733-Pyramimonas_sp.AAC.1
MVTDPSHSPVLPASPPESLMRTPQRTCCGPAEGHGLTRWAGPSLKASLGRRYVTNVRAIQMAMRGWPKKLRAPAMASAATFGRGRRWEPGTLFFHDAQALDDLGNRTFSDLWSSGTKWARAASSLLPLSGRWPS